MILQYIIVALIGLGALWVVFRYVRGLFVKPTDGGGSCGGCKGCALAQRDPKPKKH